MTDLKGRQAGRRTSQHKYFEMFPLLLNIFQCVPSHLFFLQHVSFAEDLHCIDMTGVFFLYQTNLKANTAMLIPDKVSINDF